MKTWFQLLGLLFTLTTVLGCRTPPPPSPTRLRVGIAPGQPPLCFMEGRRPAGLEVDFARALAPALKRELVLVPMPFTKLMDAVRDDAVDIAMAGLAVTEARVLKAAFTSPYLAAGQMVMVRTTDGINRDNLPVALGLARRIGVEKLSAGERFVRNHFANDRVTSFADIRDALPRLQNGQLTAIIHDAPTIIHLAATHDTLGVKAVPLLITRENLAWALNPGNRTLLAEVNQVLARWTTDGTLEATIRRWIPYYDRYDLQPAGGLTPGTPGWPR